MKEFNKTNLLVKQMLCPKVCSNFLLKKEVLDEVAAVDCMLLSCHIRVSE